MIRERILQLSMQHQSSAGAPDLEINKQYHHLADNYRQAEEKTRQVDEEKANLSNKVRELNEKVSQLEKLESSRNRAVLYARSDIPAYFLFLIDTGLILRPAVFCH